MSQQASNADSLAGCTSSQDCGKAKGTCPACYETGLRLTLGGRLYAHGAKNARCVGVGQIPLQSAASRVNNLTVNSVSLPAQSATQPSLITQPSSLVSPAPTLSTPPTLSYLHDRLQGSLPPMVKWIPRTARQHCATLLTKLIWSVVNKPKDTGEWEKLLAFGRSILHRPTKGSSRRNLTNIIARRCSEFSTNPCGAELSTSHRARACIMRKSKTDSTRGEDKGGMEGLARAVTVRLEEGNYKGAVRLLASNDALASPTPETLHALREKHPPTTFNRRPILPPDPKLRISKTYTAMDN